MPTQLERRHLEFQELDEAVVEARRLLDGGYTRAGQWSLGGVCQHLTMTQDGSLDGFDMWHMPWPIPPIMRRIALSPKAMAKPMPANAPSPKRMKPTAADSEDAERVAAFEASCQRVIERLGNGGKFERSPLFGDLGPDGWNALHVKHAAHHLGFLLPDGVA
jgi:hypothetical protein